MEQKNRMAQMIENVAIGLYQQNKTEGVEKIESMILCMMELVQTGKLCVELTKVNNVLEQAMEALELQDYVLLADILFYDLKKIILE